MFALVRSESLERMAVASDSSIMTLPQTPYRNSLGLDISDGESIYHSS